jgi:hypothetical protein
MPWRTATDKLHNPLATENQGGHDRRFRDSRRGKRKTRRTRDGFAENSKQSFPRLKELFRRNTRHTHYQALRAAIEANMPQLMARTIRVCP